MAGVSLGQGRGGKRSLDAELNLVPFIDLLSMCICFLLMTAVWVELGSVQVKQSVGTEGAAAETTSTDLEVKWLAPTRLQLQLKRGGKYAAVGELAGATPAELFAQLDAKVPTLGVPIHAVFFRTHESVPYGDLVAAMDVVRKHGMTNIGVHPGGG